METIKLIKKLEGLNTLKSIQKKLKIKRSTALKYICLLKKQGYVKTYGGGKQPRWYRVSPFRSKEKGVGFYEMINKHSPIKLSPQKEIQVVGRKLTIEEVIPWAIETKTFRIILATIALFNKVKSWSRLYQKAKERDVRRKVGALYDVARQTIKVKKMDKRTEKNLLNAKGEEQFFIKPVKSKDFKAIEKKWKVFIPLNKADLRRYKE